MGGQLVELFPSPLRGLVPVQRCLFPSIVLSLHSLSTSCSLSPLFPPLVLSLPSISPSVSSLGSATLRQTILYRYGHHSQSFSLAPSAHHVFPNVHYDLSSDPHWPSPTGLPQPFHFVMERERNKILLSLSQTRHFLCSALSPYLLVMD